MRSKDESHREGESVFKNILKNCFAFVLKMSLSGRLGDSVG